MRHLLVVAHPRRRSFTQTMARAYAKELENLGHEAVVRDLYRLRFDPVLGEGELMSGGRPIVPGVVRREQRHLAAAAAVAFFFPIWWALMPAMLKGYFDRVLSYGFAYDFEGDEIVPCLSGRKALIFTNSGADMAYLRRSKQWQSLRLIERDLILSPCAIDLLEHVHFPSIEPDLSERTLARHLERMRRAVVKHWGEAPAAQG